jgi:hypothetical protein
VNGLQTTVNHLKNRVTYCNDMPTCHTGFWDWWCDCKAVYYGIQEGLAWVAEKAVQAAIWIADKILDLAVLALKAAKKLVSLDPRVLYLEAKNGVLWLAHKVADGVVKLAMKGLQALTSVIRGGLPSMWFPYGGSVNPGHLLVTKDCRAALRIEDDLTMKIYSPAGDVGNPNNVVWSGPPTEAGCDTDSAVVKFGYDGIVSPSTCNYQSYVGDFDTDVYIGELMSSCQLNFSGNGHNRLFPEQEPQSRSSLISTQQYASDLMASLYAKSNAVSDLGSHQALPIDTNWASLLQGVGCVPKPPKGKTAKCPAVAEVNLPFTLHSVGCWGKFGHHSEVGCWIEGAWDYKPFRKSFKTAFPPSISTFFDILVDIFESFL